MDTRVGSADVVQKDAARNMTDVECIAWPARVPCVKHDAAFAGRVRTNGQGDARVGGPGTTRPVEPTAGPLPRRSEPLPCRPGPLATTPRTLVPRGAHRTTADDPPPERRTGRAR
ncbi:hypothetical protein GCM10009818_14930 [Nakamurella flavida]